MSYLFHFLIALVVSIAYFSLQADFSIELKKQKTLFILTSCVFISTFAVAYICIKPKTSVTWGNNEIQEFDYENELAIISLLRVDNRIMGITNRGLDDAKARMENRFAFGAGSWRSG